jgi:hypothetical protein
LRHAGQIHALERRAVVGDVDLDILVVELASDQLRLKLSRVDAPASGPTSASSTRSSAARVGLGFDLFALLLAHKDSDTSTRSRAMESTSRPT